MPTPETTPDDPATLDPRPPKAWKIIGAIVGMMSVWCLFIGILAAGYAYYLHLHSLR